MSNSAKRRPASVVVVENVIIAPSSSFALNNGIQRSLLECHRLFLSFLPFLSFSQSTADLPAGNSLSSAQLQGVFDQNQYLKYGDKEAA
jgi:hypothetical protein